MFKKIIIGFVVLLVSFNLDAAQKRCVQPGSVKSYVVFRTDVEIQAQERAADLASHEKRKSEDAHSEQLPKRHVAEDKK